MKNQKIKILPLIVFLGGLFLPAISLAYSTYIANGKTVIYQGLVPCGVGVCVAATTDERIVQRMVLSTLRTLKRLHPGLSFEEYCKKLAHWLEEGMGPQQVRWVEAKYNPCQLCHLAVVFQRIINFILLQVVFPVATLLLVIGGAMFFLYAENPQKVEQAKTLLTSVVIGLVIIFSAWLVVGTFFTAIGVQRWTGLWAITGTATGGGGHFIKNMDMNWTDDEFKGLPITITAGAGMGQRRIITGNDRIYIYIGHPHWNPHPGAGSEYKIGGEWFEINCPIIVKPLVEPPPPPPPPPDEPPMETKTVVFVTEDGNHGNFKGRVGANAFCKDNAPANLLNCVGIRAFISVNENDEIRDMHNHGGTGGKFDSDKPIYWWNSITGATTQLASDWEDMLDGSIGISQAIGTGVSKGIWTGSNPDGSILEYGDVSGTCQEWTIYMVVLMGTTGHWMTTNYTWMTDIKGGDCSKFRSLRCICLYEPGRLHP